MIQSKPFQSGARRLTLAIVALLACASVAWAEGSEQLVELVKPSVVQVNLKGSLGSGCVVDAEKGIIATNYHVVAHAVEQPEVNVVFPADSDGKSYPSDGFIEIQPGKDLALIHIDPTKRKLTALKIAASLPAMGAHVYAFGSPLGLSLSFTEGPVSAVRSGKQLSDIIAHMGGAGYYQKSMGYDLDAEWIQHAVPISPGNSGGPLTNAKGELLGLNTWKYGGGQGENLNFAISAIHLKKLLAGAGSNIKAFKTLPPVPDYLKHEGGPSGPGPGDPEKTLAVWKSFNKAMIKFNKKIADADKRKEAVPAINARDPWRGSAPRNKKLAAAYKLYAKAYTDFATDVKGLGSDRSVNTELVIWLVREGDLLHRIGDEYQQLSQDIAGQSGPANGLEEGRLDAFKQILNNLRTEYDLLRINLSRIFNKNFPTVDETEKDPGADSASAATQKPNSGSPDKPKSAGGAEKRFEFRTWTSKTGKFKVRAKLRGVEDGKVKLEKEDGTVIVVPLSRLSEADQRFLDST